MNVLAIETATGDVSVALADESGPLASFSVRTGRRHAESLHPAVESVLSASALSLADIDAIAVDIGPGLFTGIRVGVASAKGYSMALGVPVVALTSLEILRGACIAAGVNGQTVVVPVVDLRRGEVAWSLPAGRDREGGPAHGPPAVLAAEVDRLCAGYAPTPVVLVGDGAIRYQALLAESRQGLVTVAGSELAAPPVASLAVQAVSEWSGGRAIDPVEVRPTYLRDADTRINWSTRHDTPGLVKD